MKTILSIKGMTCSACSSGLEKYLKKQKGIEDAVVNLVMASASIEHDDSITLEDLARFVKKLALNRLEYLMNITKKKNTKKLKNILLFLVSYQYSYYI